MKPTGLAMIANNAGRVGFAVIRSDRVTDQIWEAVRDAIQAGWTPAQFKSEVQEAWECERKAQLRDELKELAK